MHTSRIGGRPKVANASRDLEPASSVARGEADVKRVSDAVDHVPEHHQALALLARSIGGMRATPAQIVASCGNDDDRADLEEACSGAAALLTKILTALKGESRKAA